jgi:putative mRNA 3-end processing factor
MIKLRTTRGHGIELPELDIGLDTNSQGMEHVFISHAHADHVPRDRHIQVYATAPTASFMKIRGFKGVIKELEFGKSLDLPAATVTLFPAGHILGSAMIHVESGEGSLLYSGDCKTPPVPSTEG